MSMAKSIQKKKQKTYSTDIVVVICKKCLRLTVKNVSISKDGDWFFIHDCKCKKGDSKK